MKQSGAHSHLFHYSLKHMIAPIWLLFHPLMKQLFFALYRIGKLWKKDAEIKQEFPNMEENGFLPIPVMPFFGRPKQLISNQNEPDRAGGAA